MEHVTLQAPWSKLVCLVNDRIARSKLSGIGAGFQLLLPVGPSVEQAIFAPLEPMLVLSCVAFFQTILTVKVMVFLFFVK